MTQYFLYANTEKKPVMRFFDHWFEVVDFMNLMKWRFDDLDWPTHVEVYQKMDIKDIEEKK